MRNDPLSAVRTRNVVTPQSEQADPRQVKNSAGGYTFTLDDEARIRRFLVLGTDGATYYTSAKELTKQNAGVILQWAESNTEALVDILKEISLAGRAPKQNPALFALAAAASLGDEYGRQYAFWALPEIARTGTMLFMFLRYLDQFRGWGPVVRREVGKWYTEKDLDKLAYQVIKYRQRENWSHKGVLQMAHPKPLSEQQDSLFKWITGQKVNREALPPIVGSFMDAQTDDIELQRIAAIALSWEMFPDKALADPTIWKVLIGQGMPMAALIRQLPRLTNLGLTREKRDVIVNQLTDSERLRKARIHPVNVLVALCTYASGHGARGSSTWTPDQHIIDALDAAFYASFEFVEPTNKRILIALDVSGSMTSPISNMPLSCREAAAAVAMTTLRTEPNADIVGFTSGRTNTSRWGWYEPATQAEAVAELTISPRQRLDDIIGYTARLDMGQTDCAAPMLWAQKQGRDYDAFVLLTDNETWHGAIHPHQALAQYRQRTGLPAKFIAVGMTPTNFTISDPSDPGSLDVVGFDSAVPTLISDFIRGF